jgi:hypothetical protein
LKRGWMRFWRSTSALFLVWVPMQPQAPGSSSRNVAHIDRGATHRQNELTLVNLRPGRDAITKAHRLFSEPSIAENDAGTRTWQDRCRHEALSINTDADGKILEVQVDQADVNSKRECASLGPDRWSTGHGLVIREACSRALALYGQPDSRGPSAKDGHQLELLYYAFDWAGPDVPQVMEVLCTPEKDGKPGRVVEIMLVAPSL